jgi:hypothetical protein
MHTCAYLTLLFSLWKLLRYQPKYLWLRGMVTIPEVDVLFWTYKYTYKYILYILLLYMYFYTHT